MAHREMQRKLPIATQNTWVFIENKTSDVVDDNLVDKIQIKLTLALTVADIFIFHHLRCMENRTMHVTYVMHTSTISLLLELAWESLLRDNSTSYMPLVP